MRRAPCRRFEGPARRRAGPLHLDLRLGPLGRMRVAGPRRREIGRVRRMRRGGVGRGPRARPARVAVPPCAPLIARRAAQRGRVGAFFAAVCVDGILPLRDGDAGAFTRGRFAACARSAASSASRAQGRISSGASIASGGGVQ